jgi:hypothetical protein
VVNTVSSELLVATIAFWMAGRRAEIVVAQGQMSWPPSGDVVTW